MGWRDRARPVQAQAPAAPEEPRWLRVSKAKQDAARLASEEEDRAARTGSTLEDVRAFFINAGNSALAGALPSAVAALTSDGGAPFAERRADAVRLLEEMQGEHPRTSISGDVFGMLGPSLAGGFVASGAARAAGQEGAKAGMMSLAKEGAKAGAPFGVLAGVGAEETGEVGNLVGAGLAGGAAGAGLGALSSLAPALAVKAAPALATPMREVLSDPLMALEDVAMQATTRIPGAVRGAAASALEGAARVLPASIPIPGTHGLGHAPTGKLAGRLTRMAENVRGTVAQPGAAGLRVDPSGAAAMLDEQMAAPLSDVPGATGAIDLNGQPAQQRPPRPQTQQLTLRGSNVQEIDPALAERIENNLRVGNSPTKVAKAMGVEERDVLEIARAQRAAPSPASTSESLPPLADDATKELTDVWRLARQGDVMAPGGEATAAWKRPPPSPLSNVAPDQLEGEATGAFAARVGQWLDEQADRTWVGSGANQLSRNVPRSPLGEQAPYGTARERAALRMREALADNQPRTPQQLEELWQSLQDPTTNPGFKAPRPQRSRLTFTEPVDDAIAQPAPAVSPFKRVPPAAQAGPMEEPLALRPNARFNLEHEIERVRALPPEQRQAALDELVAQHGQATWQAGGVADALGLRVGPGAAKAEARPAGSFLPSSPEGAHTARQEATGAPWRQSPTERMASEALPETQGPFPPGVATPSELAAFVLQQPPQGRAIAMENVRQLARMMGLGDNYVEAVRRIVDSNGALGGFSGSGSQRNVLRMAGGEFPVDENLEFALKRPAEAPPPTHSPAAGLADDFADDLGDDAGAGFGFADAPKATVIIQGPEGTEFILHDDIALARSDAEKYIGPGFNVTVVEDDGTRALRSVDGEDLRDIPASAGAQRLVQPVREAANIEAMVAGGGETEAMTRLATLRDTDIAIFSGVLDNLDDDALLRLSQAIDRQDGYPKSRSAGMTRREWVERVSTAAIFGEDWA